jgi:cytoskeletal protein RodZ
MKRCPQCSFIYEDDQGVCDMDGEELVHDPRSFPVATSTRRGQRRKSLLRSFAVLVTAFLLAAVLFVAYYASPRRVNSKSAPAAPKIENSESGTSIPPASNTPAEDPTENFLATTDSPSPSPSDAAVTKRRSFGPSARASNSPEPNPQPASSVSSVTAPELLSQTPLGVPVTALNVRPSPSPGAPVTPKLDEDKTKAASQKKESKVGSFFKKVGRVLKKPFSSKPSPK